MGYTETTNSPPEKFNDLIIYLDEKNEQQQMFVRVLDTSNLIRFETKGGNVISIPAERLIKLKQKGGVNVGE